MTFPATLAAFNKRRATFEAWLVEHGSAILAPTNPYEVIRFEGQGKPCVVYRNGTDYIQPCHWQNGALEAFQAFDQSQPWHATVRVRRNRKHENQVRSLAARDGWGCAYCPDALTEETATIEHFLSRTHGGTNHLANLGLACDPCNQKVSHLSVREKIEMAVKGRTLT